MGRGPVRQLTGPEVRLLPAAGAGRLVWQRQARFKELAQAMEASTAALVTETASKPLTAAALVAPMQRVEDSCKACHEEFRAF